jgi:hypothetical protein
LLVFQGNDFVASYGSSGRRGARRQELVHFGSDETVFGFRAAISGIIKKTLPAFASGEANIIQEYEDVFREMSGGFKIAEF